ncbi:hypothetical protein HED22_10525 [Thalassospira sp. HF15]|uniref:protein-arginine deiminase family protein n=1 Tax=Thalassospira sp. HF15 TaxID=2722755 RepID=UPI001431C0B9|nr:hypothetical protein [Thalassospira sp. HF15]
MPVDEQNINVNGNATNAKNLTVMYYTLHTDRNRDGNLDGPGTLNASVPNAISYGPNGSGAIIPVNCNRDGNNTAVGYADNQDQRINGNPDLPTGIARFEVRRNIVGPIANVPGNWTLQLHINRANINENPARNHFRVFNGDANNSTEIIGPETNHLAAITTVSVGASKTYGIEAVRFAGRSFTSGEGILNLYVCQPEVTGAGNQTYFFSERLVAARWIGNHHRQTVSRLYVANANNVAFRGDLGNAAGADNPVIPVTAGNPGIATRTQVRYLNANAWATYAPIGETVPPLQDDDVWMRDTVVSGHSTWPGIGAGVQHKDIFMKAHRWRELQNWVYESLLSTNVGVSYPAAGSTDAITSANSGGNIAVTPPVQKTVNGATTNYLYGRFYYGHNRYHTVDQSSRDFMAAQSMQPPIELDTDWLYVGHVDEMMTFIPDNNPADSFKKWKLLVASPAEAYRILNANSGAHGNARMLVEPDWDNVNNRFNYDNLQLWNEQWDTVNNRWHDVAVDVNGTINDFLGNGQAPLHNPRRDKRQQIRYTYEDLRNWNIDGVEVVIQRNIDLMKVAFDLSDQDIIRVPVIFFPEGFLPGNFTFANKISPMTWGRREGFNVFPGKQGGFQVGALTADMPNMFVGNDRLMVPKPFGPWIEAPGHNVHAATDEDRNGYDLFEQDLVQKIAAIHNGPTCVFINDWNDYHAALGEIHCGTNELRAPYNGQVAFGNARYANWWTAVNA